MTQTVVLNFHGGFPSCYIEAAFEHLPSFRKIRDRSHLHTRVYPTSSSATCTLHDMVMDAPLSSMTDACWHAWHRPSVPQRSIFHVLKAHGFHTRLMGAYGMDARFDPHSNLRDCPLGIERELEAIGVDEFDSEDVAFTCRLAAAHDASILQEAVRVVRTWTPGEKRFCMINLLACQDVHKLSWMSHSLTPHVPSWGEQRWAHMTHPSSRTSSENSLSTSHFADDPRVCDERSASTMQRVLIRMAMLSDYLKGERFEQPGRERLVRTLSALHSYVWAALTKLDAHLAPLVDALIDQGVTLIACAGHAISLYEHGMRCEAPWEGCNRSFIAFMKGGADASAVTDDAPCSMAVIAYMILRASGINRTELRIPVTDVGTAVTVCLAPSTLCRANLVPSTDALSMPCMWCRIVLVLYSRVYSVVYCWSVRDMIASTEHSGVMNLRAVDGLDETVQLVASQSEWILPLHGTPSAAFDITTDASEMDNLIARDGWSDSNECAILLKACRKVVEQYGFGGRVKIMFPKNAHKLLPEETAICSVQARPRMIRRDQISTRSYGVQTDNTVHFSRPEGRPADTEDPMRTTSRKKTPMRIRPHLGIDGAPTAGGDADPAPPDAKHDMDATTSVREQASEASTPRSTTHNAAAIQRAKSVNAAASGTSSKSMSIRRLEGQRGHRKNN